MLYRSSGTLLKIAKSVPGPASQWVKGRKSEQSHVWLPPFNRVTRFTAGPSGWMVGSLQPFRAPNTVLTRGMLAEKQPPSCLMPPPAGVCWVWQTFQTLKVHKLPTPPCPLHWLPHPPRCPAHNAQSPIPARQASPSWSKLTWPLVHSIPPGLASRSQIHSSASYSLLSHCSPLTFTFPMESSML